MLLTRFAITVGDLTTFVPVLQLCMANERLPPYTVDYKFAFYVFSNLDVM